LNKGRLNIILTEIDLTKTPIEPKLFLCKPNKQSIAILSEAYNIKHLTKFSSVNELSFSIPINIELNHQLQRNPNIDKIKDRYLIKLKKDEVIEYYMIDKIVDSSDDSSDTKEISCLSLQYELADKLIRSYEVVSYNALQVLTDALSQTLWSIDYIDPIYLSTYRSFSVSSKTVLDFVIEIAETFASLIIYNTVSRTISLYNPDNIGITKDLRFSYGNLIKTIEQTINMDNFATRLKVYGENNLTIASVNPTGQDWIENMVNFMTTDYMSQGLINAIVAYEALIVTNTDAYSTLLSQLTVQQELLTTKQNEMDALEIQLVIIQDSLDIALSTSQPTAELIAQRDAKQLEIDAKLTEISSVNLTITVSTNCTISGNISFTIDGITTTIAVLIDDTVDSVATKINTEFNKLYTNSIRNKTIPIYKSTVLNNVVTLIYFTNSDQSDIVAIFNDDDSTGVTTSISIGSNFGVENLISNIENQITALQSTLSIENNFTADQILERNLFIIEKEATNSNYTNASDLYEYGKKEFEKICKPEISIKLDIVNFLEVLEMQHLWDKLVLGDFCTVYYPPLNISIKARIIEVDFDYESGSISLTIANVEEILTDEQKFIRNLYNSISTSTSVNMSKYKILTELTQNTSEISTIIDQLQGKISKEITLAVNEHVSISPRGIIITSPQNPLDILIINSGVIALSNDGGNTWGHCISTDGILGDKVIGKLGIFAQVRADSIILGDLGETLPSDVLGDNVIKPDTNYNGAFISQDGFKVKNSLSQEVVEMGEFLPDEYGLRASHTDGSYTQLTANGLERLVVIEGVDTSKPYYYETEIVPGSTIGLGDGYIDDSEYTPEEEIIQKNIWYNGISLALSSKFRNKNFNISLALTQLNVPLVNTGNDSVMNFFVKSIDYVNGIVDVVAYTEAFWPSNGTLFRGLEFIIIATM